MRKGILISRIYLTHFSAFALIRYARANNGRFLSIGKIRLSKQTPSKIQLMELQKNISKIINQNIKLDVMVKSSCPKERLSFARIHYSSQNLHCNMFKSIKVNNKELQKNIFDKIYISSPELCFLQMSTKFTQERLILFGLELCGSYAIDLNNNKGFRDGIAPITTVNKIHDEINCLKGLRLGNYQKTLRTLKWISEHSASPAESKLFLLFCGPRKLGFFQIRKLELNKQIALSQKAKAICGYSKIKPDMCYIKNKLAIEYDSKAFHEEVEQNQKDKSRVMALTHDG